MVQQPFEWGYQGMKLMAAYLEGDKSAIPADGLIIVPTKVIDKANVDAFAGRPEGQDRLRVELTARRAGAGSPAPRRRLAVQAWQSRSSSS